MTEITNKHTWEGASLLDTLEKMKTELAHLYHNKQILANAPERERIYQMILDAEYAIEQAKDNP